MDAAFVDCRWWVHSILWLHFINSGSLSFFCHCRKRNKKSRQEGYTAPSCRIALWYGSTTVVCTIDLYCTPLMQALFVFAAVGTFYFMTIFVNIHSLSFFCHCRKRNKKARQEGYTAPSCRIALWYGCAAVVCPIDLYCTPSVQAAFIIGGNGTYSFWWNFQIATICTS